MAKGKHNVGYRWVDKDPVIDLIRTAYLDSNLSAKQVCREARIHPNTLDNMLYGKTIKPQNATVAKIMDALGIDVKYVYRAGGVELVVESRVGCKFRTKPKGKVRRRFEARKAESAKHKLRVVNG